MQSVSEHTFHLWKMLSSSCHSPCAKPSEQALLCYLWLCSKHHLCSSTLPKSHSFAATEGTAEILFCPGSKRHHKPVDEQRVEHISQKNSSARRQRSSHRERGLQKESKMWLADVHTYTIFIYPHPTSHPFLKMNTDFLSPETEGLEVHLVQAELTKTTP